MIKKQSSAKGLIFDIDTFAVHDGPGIRMAVYLKGCPLSCQWCHSPESQRPGPQLIFMRDRCKLCGICCSVCPGNIHSIEDGKKHIINWKECTACGKCVEHCPCNALAIKGYYISVDELVSKAKHLKPFFKHSGGGVTLTGGEITNQPNFAVAILKGCQSSGIHTAIETNGACDWPVLKQIIAHTDLILYDLKLFNEKDHIQRTGMSNRQILDNARRLVNHNIQVRIPLIPKITDTEDNLYSILSFMKNAGLRSVALLPYNPSSQAKYQWLGSAYKIQGKTQNHNKLNRIIKMANKMKLKAVIN